MGLVDDGRIRDKADSIELANVGVPPKNVQPHVVSDGDLVVLFRESLETREKAAEEAP